jgi:hypothetical protein
MPRDQAATNKLSTSNLHGPDHRTAISKTALRGVRRSAALSQAAADGRCAADRWGVEASGVARFGGRSFLCL